MDIIDDNSLHRRQLRPYHMHSIHQLGGCTLQQCPSSLLFRQAFACQDVAPSSGESIRAGQCASCSRILNATSRLTHRFLELPQGMHMPLTETRGSTEKKMTDPIAREHIGSAMTHPLYWMHRDETMTPALPSVSATTCRYTAWGGATRQNVLQKAHCG